MTNKETRFTIGHMPLYKEGYCVAWAIQFDEDGNHWLRTNHEVKEESGGTIHVKIRRVRNGFEVSRASIGGNTHKFIPIQANTPLERVIWVD